MSNLTEQELDILLSIPTRKQYQDLGTEIVPKDNAEMYYNYNTNSCSGSYSCSYSTLQQSTEPTAPTDESVATPQAARLLPSPSAPSLKENQGIPGVRGKDVGSKIRKNIPRKISKEHNYTQINMSVNDIRRGKRTDRITAYLSIKEENDKKFTIFLRSSLTTEISETRRLLKQKDNRPLLDALEEIQINCPTNAKFFAGRFRYNPRTYKLEDEHKSNLKSAILGIYDYGDRMTAVIFMFDEYYVIELTDDLTTKQQGMFDFTGSFQRDIEEEE